MKRFALNTLFNLGVFGFGLFALCAAASASDVANVKIITAHGEEAVEVDLDALKVGESRQLVAASGAPAVVTRSEDGLRIEVGGKVTEIKLAPLQVAEWHHSDGGEGKQIKLIKLDHGDTTVVGEGGHERKIVIMHGDGAQAAPSDEEIAELIAEVESKVAADTDGDADGDKVIVTRKVVRETDQP